MIKHCTQNLSFILKNRSIMLSQLQTWCYSASFSPKSGIKTPSINNNIQNEQKESDPLTRSQVLKTYLEIIPPYRLQQIIHPQKSTIITELSSISPEGPTIDNLQILNKKLKKNVHMIPVNELANVLETIRPSESTSKECKALTYKIYTRILANVYKKLNILPLEQIVDFMYKMVKSNYKEFEFIKEVERIIIEEKIKVNYPLIRKILWVYTHLDVGSSVLYAHISKTLKIGQHQLAALELAESAFMLSKTSENASGGYGVFLIAQKHLLAQLPRLPFHDLVKAGSYMLTQNIGSNAFQEELEAELYRKYPDKPNFRINDLVTLLKSTSSYYFKYKEKALLNMLQTSTRKLAPQANLQQFQDIIWSWGRAAKGDRELWSVLQNEIHRKYLNLLKPRQLAFFYYSLCSTEYSSVQTINLLEKKFMQIVQQNQKINQHYLLKFLLGMKKRQSYNQATFNKICSLVVKRMQQLSTKQLITFCKIINESDLSYQNREKFVEMQTELLKVCKKGINQKIYMFKVSQIVEILYMWIKLGVKEQRNGLVVGLIGYLNKVIEEIPKSVFIKALFCFTIRDQYREAYQMVGILENLLKYGPIGYFFSPYDLPLAAYCVYHLEVNNTNDIQIAPEIISQLGSAMDKINPVILNSFVRNGYEQCLRLKTKYMHDQQGNESQQKSKKRKK